MKDKFTLINEFDRLTKEEVRIVERE